MCYAAKIKDLSTPEKRDEWFYIELERQVQAVMPTPAEEWARRAEEIVRRARWAR